MFLQNFGIFWKNSGFLKFATSSPSKFLTFSGPNENSHEKQVYRFTSYLRIDKTGSARRNTRSRPGRGPEWLRKPCLSNWSGQEELFTISLTSRAKAPNQKMSMSHGDSETLAEPLVLRGVTAVSPAGRKAYPGDPRAADHGRENTQPGGNSSVKFRSSSVKFALKILQTFAKILTLILK